MKIMTAKIFKSKDTVVSSPPEGFKKIVAIYIEPESGTLVVIQEE